jgi:predicted GNAT superfamily acetyltransferase
MMNNWSIKILDTIDQLLPVEDLQRLVWPGSDTDIVPAHLLLTAVHNGGIVLGAFSEEGSSRTNSQLLGFVFGFPGIYQTPDGPRLKHCSHILAVHPEFRSKGLGFRLKRAQWQMVRKQGVDRITWTYDPLLSRNAHLNISRLGAVCSTYHRDYYGEMRDGLNIGLPSDRFEVDWWVNSQRVQKRLSAKARPRLDLDHYLAAEAEIINLTSFNDQGWVIPASSTESILDRISLDQQPVLLLVEIPADFLTLKDADFELASDWRSGSRKLFEALFSHGYLVTDFVYIPGDPPRSYYVFSHGEGTL